MTDKYYAAVDKDGYKAIYQDMPIRNPFNEWEGYIILSGIEMNRAFPAFPNITWEDEPVQVELSIKVIHD